MPAVYQTAPPTLDKVRGGVQASGQITYARRLLGATGAGAIGNGAWYSARAMGWKTFILRSQDQSVAVGGVARVRIECCNELASLPGQDAETVTQAVVLATLSAASPIFTYEPAIGYVRAFVEVAGAAPVQVDLSAIGL